MKLEKIELFIIALPLVRPFRTSFGTQTSREVLIVKVVNENGTTGWAECVAMSEPLYSPEYVAGCLDLMKRFLIPALKSKPTITAEEVAPVLKPFLGAPMAKAALETAILDAQLQDQKISLATYLGATKARVACGVSVGIANDLSALADEVCSYIEQGYQRIKLKIEPGWDIAAVKKIRDLYPTILLQVDANQAYTRDDGKHLAALDEFNLLLIEQPLDEHDILGHALLAKQVKTPICLDESIISLQSARDALELKATTIINVKPGRVGGYIESVKIHDLCIKNKIPVWCGGMLETGIGRAANLALAALPGFTLPGDTSASSRYFSEDLTAPFVMNDGYLDVPNTTGIGITPNLDFLDSITTYREEI
ncbi:MAG: O-succinylbenzoate synthase [Actinomycetota bacterium]